MPVLCTTTHARRHHPAPSLTPAAAWVARRYRVKPHLAATIAALAGLGGQAR